MVYEFSIKCLNSHTSNQFHNISRVLEKLKNYKAWMTQIRFMLKESTQRQLAMFFKPFMAAIMDVFIFPHSCEGRPWNHPYLRIPGTSEPNTCKFLQKTGPTAWWQRKIPWIYRDSSNRRSLPSFFGGYQHVPTIPVNMCPFSAVGYL